MAKGDLGSQLADIFKKGLEADPKSAQSLASTLSSHVTSMSDGYTKAEANYHTATDTKRECGTCDNFDGDSGCKIVSGSISPDGTCDYWSGESDTGGTATTDSGAGNSSESLSGISPASNSN